MRTITTIAALLLLAACGSDSEGGGGDEPDIGDEIGAQVVCQDFVEDSLKSPATAEFSDEEARHVKGKVWEVSGSVDSENSFGAMIRNDYTCQVRYMGDDNWRLVSLTGLDN